MLKFVAGISNNSRLINRRTQGYSISTSISICKNSRFEVQFEEIAREFWPVFIFFFPKELFCLQNEPEIIRMYIYETRLNMEHLSCKSPIFPFEIKIDIILNPSHFCKNKLRNWSHFSSIPPSMSRKFGIINFIVIFSPPNIIIKISACS